MDKVHEELLKRGILVDHHLIPEIESGIYKREYLKQVSSQNASYLLKRQEKIARRKHPTHCESCGKSQKRLQFDHDHKTGKFRGWLCSRCNIGLGYYEDRVLMYNLRKYLENIKQ